LLLPTIVRLDFLWLVRACDGRLPFSVYGYGRVPKRKVLMKDRRSPPIFGNAFALVVVSLAIAGSRPVVAAQADTQITRRDTVVSNTRIGALSEQEIELAEAWSLSETEWRRYRRLMQGIRSSVSSTTLSPIEVLGIHARDASERRQYAERWAIAMREDAERILAFQHAYDEAVERLYPDQRLIDTVKLSGGPAQITVLRSNDRLIVRATLNCPSCDATIAKALARLDDVSGIDIFFADVPPKEQEAIRDWAKTQAIKPAWVLARRVTLNVDRKGSDLAIASEALPSVYVKRGERVQPFAYAAL